MKTSPELAAALQAAEAAAEVIRAHYGRYLETSGEARRISRAPGVRLKADRSPVTDADVQAEQAVRGLLAERFPDHGFYGEETGASAMDAEYLWLVDPIDGTRAFVRGYPMFSTQIALMHRGRIVLGVSSAPVYGELAWAERGQGAWLNGARLAASDVDSLEQCALSAGNLRTLAGSDRWPAYGRLVSRVSRIRGYGDFLHYHLLAAGCIDAVIESDVNILDIAALSVIVEEAGGRFTDLEGGPFTLETTSVLASNGRLHEPVLRALSFKVA
jgi:histidinol-phosphatase